MDQALALPEQERAFIAAKLLESLRQEPNGEVERTWLAELERRAREAMEDESVLEDWEVVEARLRGELRSRER